MSAAYPVPRGTLPVLQYATPAMLTVDPSYQRTLDAAASQALIRRIAQRWDWGLCQPLVVARRPGEEALYVIDGQHRLAAARLRGDIAQLPCVIGSYASAADEAANFVALNQSRRPLTRFDLFRAAVASGEEEATAIVAALAAAGLAVAPHSNYATWPPMVLGALGGLIKGWRQYGPAIASAALLVLARAFDGQVLRYAGTILPGIIAVVADEVRQAPDWIAGDDWIDWEYPDLLVTMLGGASQDEWRADIAALAAADPTHSLVTAAAQVIRAAWADTLESYGADDTPEALAA